jgi:NADP-dependent 3-hydroxy acid dehydrogenase YdfG
MSLGNIIVTGGASGLGAAVAAALADAGGRPMVLDRTPPDEAGEFILVDLADRIATERAVRTASERLGGIDAVVTCAGIDSCGRLEDVDAAAWEQVIRVNLLGTVAVVRAALPELRRRRGSVVTVASTLGLRAVSDATAYCASKFGVVGFTRALAAETAGQVRVTLLVPGGMQTPFFDGRDEQYKPGADAQLIDPARVADGILFALHQPAGVEVRELVMCPEEEPPWP